VLFAEGNVIVFINGNVQLQKGFSIDAAPEARVTLIVKGSLNVGGGFSLGNTSADRHLLITDNGNQIHFNPGINVVGGSLYAPTVQLVTTKGAPLQVNGALLVYDAVIDDTLRVLNLDAATHAAESCS
jgi:hypothetical protein